MRFTEYTGVQQRGNNFLVTANGALRSVIVISPSLLLRIAVMARRAASQCG